MRFVWINVKPRLWIQDVLDCLRIVVRFRYLVLGKKLLIVLVFWLISCVLHYWVHLAWLRGEDWHLWLQRGLESWQVPILL